MKVAVVDVDGTLIRENTTRGFLAWLAARGHRSLEIRVALSKPVSWLGWKTGFDLARRLLVRALRGLTRAEIDARAAEYVTSLVASRTHASVANEVEALRRDGFVIVLATGTVDPVSRALAAQFRTDHLVTAELAFDAGGRATGALARDVAGRKATALDAWLAGRTLERLVVFTDNREDQDLMRRADRVVFLGPSGEPVPPPVGPGSR